MTPEVAASARFVLLAGGLHTPPARPCRAGAPAQSPVAGAPAPPRSCAALIYKRLNSASGATPVFRRFLEAPARKP
jgi:hypothetical protein